MSTRRLLCAHILVELPRQSPPRTCWYDARCTVMADAVHLQSPLARPCTHTCDLDLHQLSIKAIDGTKYRLQLSCRAVRTILWSVRYRITYQRFELALHRAGPGLDVRCADLGFSETCHPSVGSDGHRHRTSCTTAAHQRLALFHQSSVQTRVP